MQKAIFLELEPFFKNSLFFGKILTELSEQQIDIQCNYSFHLHHQLKNLKVFVTTGMSTICPGMGSHTSFLPLI